MSRGEDKGSGFVIEFGSDEASVSTGHSQAAGRGGVTAEKKKGTIQSSPAASSSRYAKLISLDLNMYVVSNNSLVSVQFSATLSSTLRRKPLDSSSITTLSASETETRKLTPMEKLKMKMRMGFEKQSEYYVMASCASPQMGITESN